MNIDYSSKRGGFKSIMNYEKSRVIKSIDHQDENITNKSKSK